MNYLIMDKTENTGNAYIGEGGENCHLEESAMVFATTQEAKQMIENNKWSEWAYVAETNYPTNQ